MENTNNILNEFTFVAINLGLMLYRNEWVAPHVYTGTSHKQDGTLPFVNITSYKQNITSKIIVNPNPLVNTCLFSII